MSVKCRFGKMSLRRPTLSTRRCCRTVARWDPNCRISVSPKTRKKILGRPDVAAVAETTPFRRKKGGTPSWVLRNKTLTRPNVWEQSRGLIYSSSQVHDSSFSSWLSNGPDKLECLSLASLSSLGNVTLQLIGPIYKLWRIWRVSPRPCSPILD
jgi:hypothetical protein